VSGNTAGIDGGVYNYGPLSLRRSLLSGNTAANGPEVYSVGGSVTANDYNLFGLNSMAGVVGFSYGSSSDIVPGSGVLLNSILSPLGNNGGPTQTHALPAGSPAIDASPADAGCEAADQRGVTRPQFAACDIGAFEVEVVAVCGNGMIEGSEACDDGNTTPGDCCSATCTIEPATTECRGSAGPCDVAESCTGSSAACPADTFAASTQSCTGASQGGACDKDSADHCSGTANTCVDVFQGSTVVCRSGAGVCDVAESCTGSSAACPSDGFVAGGTQCRCAAGVCDVAEACTGTGPTCPENAFQPPTFECRAEAGECDIAENCSGTSAACPADAVDPAGTACPADTTPCTQDICTGTSVECTHPSALPTHGCTVNLKPNKLCLGTGNADLIQGTFGNDVIIGGGGNDTLYGLAGNDIVCGQEGNDQLDGGPGADTLNGGLGTDTCKAGEGLVAGSSCETVVP